MTTLCKRNGDRGLWFSWENRMFGTFQDVSAAATSTSGPTVRVGSLGCSFLYILIFVVECDRSQKLTAHSRFHSEC